jgi:hypothetical protein
MDKKHTHTHTHTELETRSNKQCQTKLAKNMKRKQATADERDKEILLSQNCAGETGEPLSDARSL